MVSRRFVLATSFLLASVMAACAGESVANRDFVGQACATCIIKLERMVVLGIDDSAAAAGPRYPTQLVRLSDGRYLMGPSYEPGTATLFSSEGRFEGTIGAFGRGPGEMNEVTGVTAWAGDSAGVLHDRNEISIFDSENEYKRHFSISSVSFLTNDVRVSGSDLLARRTGTGGGRDHEIKEISMDGVPGIGFGGESQFSTGRVYSDFVLSGDTIWAANSSSYEIDAYRRSSGQRVGTIVRKLDWFPPDGPRKDWGGRPSIQNVMEMSPGKLLVLLVRPRDEFQLKGTVDQSDDAERAARSTENADLQERFVQVLEVLDLDSREAAASLVIEDKWLGGFVSKDEVFAYEEDETSGALRLSIWKVSLPLGR
jgi:hypothetical protein